jgi:hypothetical protein
LEVVAAASQNQCRSCCHACTTKPAHSFFLIDLQITGEIRIPEFEGGGRADEGKITPESV